MGKQKLKEMSIFVDESGDYGILGDKLKKSKHNKQDELYVISLVFHNKEIDISKQIEYQDNKNKQHGFTEANPLHFAPLIRGENDFYKSFSNEEKINVLLSELYFIKDTDITCAVLTLDKTKVNTMEEFKTEYVNMINNLFLSCSNYFNSFDLFKIYYDDGQGLVKKIIKESCFCINKQNEFSRKIKIFNYQLHALCDFLCTIELIRFKRRNDCSSSNELAVFPNKETFKKRYIKEIKKKLITNNYLNKNL